MADLFNQETKPAVMTPIETPAPSFRDNIFYKAIVEDILKPAAIDAAYDAGHSFLNWLCYRSFGRNRGRRAGRDGDYISYNTYYKEDKNRESTTVISNKPKADPYRGRADVTIFPFDSLFDIDNALDEMAVRLQASHKLTVSDMYDIADISGAPHTAENLGWTDISKAKKSRDPYNPDKWVIVMPQPRNIRDI